MENKNENLFDKIKNFNPEQLIDSLKNISNEDIEKASQSIFDLLGTSTNSKTQDLIKLMIQEIAQEVKKEGSLDKDDFLGSTVKIAETVARKIVLKIDLSASENIKKDLNEFFVKGFSLLSNKLSTQTETKEVIEKKEETIYAIPEKDDDEHITKKRRIN